MAPKKLRVNPRATNRIVLRSATRVRMQMRLDETEFNRMINCTVALSRVPRIDRMGLLIRRVLRGRRASMSNMMIGPAPRLRSNSLDDRRKPLSADFLADFRRQMDEAVQVGDIADDPVSDNENDENVFSLAELFTERSLGTEVRNEPSSSFRESGAQDVFDNSEEIELDPFVFEIENLVNDTVNDSIFDHGNDKNVLALGELFTNCTLGVEVTNEPLLSFCESGVQDEFDNSDKIEPVPVVRENENLVNDAVNDPFFDNENDENVFSLVELFTECSLVTEEKNERSLLFREPVVQDISNNSDEIEPVPVVCEIEYIVKDTINDPVLDSENDGNGFSLVELFTDWSLGAEVTIESSQSTRELDVQVCEMEGVLKNSDETDSVSAESINVLKTEECGQIENAMIENVHASENKYMLPAPYNRRGRRPSVDCDRMETIPEQLPFFVCSDSDE